MKPMSVMVEALLEVGSDAVKVHTQQTLPVQLLCVSLLACIFCAACHSDRSAVFHHGVVLYILFFCVFAKVKYLCIYISLGNNLVTRLFKEKRVYIHILVKENRVKLLK